MPTRFAAAGIVAALVLAIIGAAVASLVKGVPAAPLVLIGGVLVAMLQASAALAPGAQWAGSHLLRVGVALLGAQLSVAAILDYGLASIAWIVLAIGAVFAVAVVLGRRWDVPPTLRLLIAAGIGICGNSAIAAIAPLVKAERSHVAVAVGVITVSGMLSVLAYPVIGALLDLSDTHYGVWSGIAIADTGQVLAAALAYGPNATEIATVTKLTRNAFIGPVAILVAMAWASRHADVGAERHTMRLATAVPPFVVAFVLLAALRSFGVIGDDVAGLLASAGSFIILVGLAGIGLSTRVGSLTSAGLAPIALGAFIVIGLSAITLGLLLTIG